MSIALLQLSLPVAVIAAFVQWKLPEKGKEWLFKLPVWLTATILAFGIAHAAPGVMGYYAAILCDLMLFPIMTLQKKNFENKKAGKSFSFPKFKWSSFRKTPAIIAA